MTASSQPPFSSERLGALLQLCAQGDKSGMAELYRLAAPKLFSLLLRILRREDLAEETLQEGFLNIWRHAADYDPKKGAPFTWMTSIMRHRAIDQLRRRRHEIVSEGDLPVEPVSDASGPWENLIQSLSAEGLRKCLEELGEEQRRTILSAYYEGLTHEELALRLGKPLGTVKTWIRRGLANLKGCLERCELLILNRRKFLAENTCWAPFGVRPASASNAKWGLMKN